jgi:hypothetical protein
MSAMEHTIETLHKQLEAVISQNNEARRVIDSEGALHVLPVT